MGDLEDGPLGLVLGHTVRGRVLRVLHLDVEDLEVVPDVVEAGGRLLGPRRVRADRGHGGDGSWSLVWLVGWRV